MNNLPLPEAFMLTQAQLKSVLSYDHITGDFAWRKTSSGRSVEGSLAGCIFTSRAGKSYRRIQISGKSYYAHRLAWLWVYGCLPKDQLDHIDGDGLNNAIRNLRECDNSENQRNARLRGDNVSGVVGVSWHKQFEKWAAYINANNKKNHLGLYDDFYDAVAARRDAEQKYGYHENHGSIRDL